MSVLATPQDRPGSEAADPKRFSSASRVVGSKPVLVFVALLVGLGFGVAVSQPALSHQRAATGRVEARLSVAQRSRRVLARELRDSRRQLAASRTAESAAASTIVKLHNEAQQTAALVAQQQAELVTASEAADRAAATGGSDPSTGDVGPAPPVSVEGGDSISGDGVLAIGTDVAPGVWNTEGSPSCYSAILNSADNTDVDTNDTTDGPTSIDLPAGKFFETIGCGTWTKG
jgi:hypothetical protein